MTQKRYISPKTWTLRLNLNDSIAAGGEEAFNLSDATTVSSGAVLNAKCITFDDVEWDETALLNEELYYPKLMTLEEWSQLPTIQ